MFFVGSVAFKMCLRLGQMLWFSSSSSAVAMRAYSQLNNPRVVDAVTSLSGDALSEQLMVGLGGVPGLSSNPFRVHDQPGILDEQHESIQGSEVFGEDGRYYVQTSLRGIWEPGFGQAPVAIAEAEQNAVLAGRQMWSLASAAGRYNPQRSTRTGFLQFLGHHTEDVILAAARSVTSVEMKVDIDNFSDKLRKELGIARFDLGINVGSIARGRTFPDRTLRLFGTLAAMRDRYHAELDGRIQALHQQESDDILVLAVLSADGQRLLWSDGATKWRKEIFHSVNDRRALPPTRAEIEPLLLESSSGTPGAMGPPRLGPLLAGPWVDDVGKFKWTIEDRRTGPVLHSVAAIHNDNEDGAGYNVDGRFERIHRPDTEIKNLEHAPESHALHLVGYYDYDHILSTFLDAKNKSFPRERSLARVPENGVPENHLAAEVPIRTEGDDSIDFRFHVIGDTLGTRGERKRARARFFESELVRKAHASYLYWKSEEDSRLQLQFGGSLALRGPGDSPAPPVAPKRPEPWNSPRTPLPLFRVFGKRDHAINTISGGNYAYRGRNFLSIDLPGAPSLQFQFERTDADPQNDLHRGRWGPDSDDPSDDDSVLLMREVEFVYMDLLPLPERMWNNVEFRRRHLQEVVAVEDGRMEDGKDEDEWLFPTLNWSGGDRWFNLGSGGDTGTKRRKGTGRGQGYAYLSEMKKPANRV